MKNKAFLAALKCCGLVHWMCWNHGRTSQLVLENRCDLSQHLFMLINSYVWKYMWLKPMVMADIFIPLRSPPKHQLSAFYWWHAHTQGRQWGALKWQRSPNLHGVLKEKKFLPPCISVFLYVIRVHSLLATRCSKVPMVGDNPKGRIIFGVSA